VLFVVGGLAPIFTGFVHGAQTADTMVFINQSGYMII
jgi:hypothetical protein